MKTIAIAAVCSMVAAVAGAQVFRSGVDVVQIDVSVMDGNRPVTGLTVDDFALTDNGVQQTLDSAAVSALPLSVTLVLDTSASLRGERLDNLIAAGAGLTRALRIGERAA